MSPLNRLKVIRERAFLCRDQPVPAKYPLLTQVEDHGAAPPVGTATRLLLTGCARGLLTHLRDDAAYLAAVALNDRSKFGALSDHHADALDNQVVDFIAAIVVSQLPIDPERCLRAGAHNVGRNDYAVPIDAAATDFEGLTSKVAQPCSVHVGGVVLKQLYKFPLLGLPRRSPITAENEASNTGAVEILVEQFPKPRFSDGEIGLLAQHLDGSTPELVHKCDGIRRVYRWRRRAGRGREQDKNTGQNRTAHHIDRTPI